MRGARPSRAWRPPVTLCANFALTMRAALFFPSVDDLRCTRTSRLATVGLCRMPICGRDSFLASARVGAQCDHTVTISSRAPFASVSIVAALLVFVAAMTPAAKQGPLESGSHSAGSHWIDRVPAAYARRQAGRALLCVTSDRLMSWPRCSLFIVVIHACTY